MHSADCAVARYLSVRPSVTRQYCVKTAKRIIKLFHRHVDIRFWFFDTKRYGNIRTGTPNRGVECGWDMKKSRFSTNISLYIGKDARYGYSYYVTPIGTHV